MGNLTGTPWVFQALITNYKVKRQFKKYLRYHLILRLNETHAEGVLRLARFVEARPGFVSAKIKSVDRDGMDLVAAERDGSISEIRLAFARRVHGIQDAERLIVEWIEQIEA